MTTSKAPRIVFSMMMTFLLSAIPDNDRMHAGFAYGIMFAAISYCAFIASLRLNTPTKRDVEQRPNRDGAILYTSVLEGSYGN